MSPFWRLFQIRRKKASHLPVLFLESAGKKVRYETLAFLDSLCFLRQGEEDRKGGGAPSLWFWLCVIKRSFPIIVRNNYSWLHRAVNQQNISPPGKQQEKEEEIHSRWKATVLPFPPKSIFMPLNWPTETRKMVLYGNVKISITAQVIWRWTKRDVGVYEGEIYR